MTLSSVGKEGDPKSVSEVGSMLFKRGVSGARVVTGQDTKVIEEHTFKGKTYSRLCSEQIQRSLKPVSCDVINIEIHSFCSITHTHLA